MTHWSALLTLLLVATGCGAIQSTANLMDADVQLEAARTAGAEKYAPYTYTSAKLYLHQARREAGFSNYEVAVDYAKKAARYATTAHEQAVQRSHEGPAAP